MARRIDIPRTIDAVDAAWLSDALGTSIEAVTRLGPPRGIAMTSRVARLALRGAGPASLVVKLAHPDRPHPSMYAREVRAYRELTGLPRPRCWFAGLEEDAFVLLLEDLSDAVPGHPFEGASEHQAHALFRTVADWHREHWGGHAAWADKAIPPAELHAKQVREGWEMLDRQRFVACPRLERAMARMIDGMGDAFDALRASPTTLVHGDLHVENVVFDGLRTIVLDWQNASTGPAALDVAGALTCVAPGIVATHGRSLLDTYRRAVPGVPEDVDAAVRGAVAFVAGAVAWLATHVDRTERKLDGMQAHWASLASAVCLTWGD